ncbi:hypothetical protein [Burkholderia gladioli]|uniref:hypothetical protein n=1 Tax=Burkholderia gladioli TaxID=28095 RepID=UPI00163E74B9|nr:hypothetical protein [Burkholderia gladioli]
MHAFAFQLGSFIILLCIAAMAIYAGLWASAKTKRWWLGVAVFLAIFYGLGTAAVLGGISVPGGYSENE